MLHQEGRGMIYILGGFFCPFILHATVSIFWPERVEVEEVEEVEEVQKKPLRTSKTGLQKAKQIQKRNKMIPIIIKGDVISQIEHP